MFDNNTPNNQENGQTTFLTRAANDGALLGLLLAAAVVFIMLGTTNGFYMLFSLIIFFAVPFVVYNFLKRSYLASKYNATFSLLWMEGINTFICGGLIMALAIFVYLRFYDPQFVVTQIESAIEICKQDAGMADLAVSLQALIDQNQLPTPISVAFSNMFSVVFSGSLLSAVISLIVRALNRKPQQTPPPFEGTKSE